MKIVVSGGSRIFPRGGREPSRGGVNTPNFPENCMKSKEFGRPGGGVRPSRPPPDPPMVVADGEWDIVADLKKDSELLNSVDVIGYVMKSILMIPHNT